MKFWLYNPINFIACGFGSGLIPKAPGTFGTLVAVPICYFGYSWLQTNNFYQWLPLILLTLFVFGIFICSYTSIKIADKDPKQIVFDEIIGYAIAVSQVPITAQNFILAFLLFRFFDIVKPFPIRLVDKKLTGGLGIMLDDVLAGLATCGILIIIN